MPVAFRLGLFVFASARLPAPLPTLRCPPDAHPKPRLSARTVLHKLLPKCAIWRK